MMGSYQLHKVQHELALLLYNKLNFTGDPVEDSKKQMEDSEKQMEDNVIHELESATSLTPYNEDIPGKLFFNPSIFLTTSLKSGTRTQPTCL
jgi:hypothetical protein